MQPPGPPPPAAAERNDFYSIDEIKRKETAHPEDEAESESNLAEFSMEERVAIRRGIIVRESAGVQKPARSPLDKLLIQAARALGAECITLYATTDDSEMRDVLYCSWGQADGKVNPGFEKLKKFLDTSPERVQELLDSLEKQAAPPLHTSNAFDFTSIQKSIHQLETISFVLIPFLETIDPENALTQFSKTSLQQVFDEYKDAQNSPLMPKSIYRLCLAYITYLHHFEIFQKIFKKSEFQEKLQESSPYDAHRLAYAYFVVNCLPEATIDVLSITLQELAPGCMMLFPSFSRSLQADIALLEDVSRLPLEAKQQLKRHVELGDHIEVQDSSFTIWNLVQARLNTLHGALRALFQNKIILICR